MSDVCGACSDTHRVTVIDSDGRRVTSACARCPIPCDHCRGRHGGAYCASIPCFCQCHRSATPTVQYGGLCPQHGEVVRVGEDGTCIWCGSDSCGEGVDAVLRERDELRAVVGRLVEAMAIWGSWEDGVPAAGDDEMGRVGRAYDAGCAIVGAPFGPRSD